MEIIYKFFSKHELLPLCFQSAEFYPLPLAVTDFAKIQKNPLCWVCGVINKVNSEECDCQKSELKRYLSFKGGALLSIRNDWLGSY